MLGLVLTYLGYFDLLPPQSFSVIPLFVFFSPFFYFLLLIIFPFPLPIFSPTLHFLPSSCSPHTSLSYPFPSIVSFSFPLLGPSPLG